jgi:hypothetical protein
MAHIPETGEEVNSVKGKLSSFEVDDGLAEQISIGCAAGQSQIAAPQDSFLAQFGGRKVGRAGVLCPGIPDINLFRYCEGVIDLGAEVSEAQTRASHIGALTYCDRARDDR